MCSNLSGWPVKPQNAAPLLTPTDTSLAHRESGVDSAAALLQSCSPRSIPSHLSPPLHWNHMHQHGSWGLGELGAQHAPVAGDVGRAHAGPFGALPRGLMAATCTRPQALLLSGEASSCCLHNTHNGSHWRSRDRAQALLLAPSPRGASLWHRGAPCPGEGSLRHGDWQAALGGTVPGCCGLTCHL